MTAGVHAAEDFPNKPVRMVIPLAPGGGSDIVGRIVAQGLSDYWGKPVVVDNRPGAGSIVGTAIVAKTPGDGYTLLVSSSSFAISPALYKNSGFDAQKDFTGITMLASQPSLLVVNAGVAAKSLPELLALAKAKPGQLAYGSAGIGSATHLGSELFLYTAKLKMQHIPYKSAGLATTAVLSGEVQLLMTNAASVLPHIAGGKIRALGVSAKTRSALAPEVPTVAESGVPGYEANTWNGMLAPAGTPRAIVMRLNQEMLKILGTREVIDYMTADGAEPAGGTPEQFATCIRTDHAKWAGVIRDAKIIKSN